MQLEFFSAFSGWEINGNPQNRKSFILLGLAVSQQHHFSGDYNGSISTVLHILQYRQLMFTKKYNYSSSKGMAKYYFLWRIPPIYLIFSYYDNLSSGSSSFPQISNVISCLQLSLHFWIVALYLCTCLIEHVLDD